MKRLITTLILPLLLLTACKGAEKFDPGDYYLPAGGREGDGMGAG